MAQLRLLATQIDIPPMTTARERDQHLAALAEMISARLSDNPHDLVVLPELSSVDYARATFDNLAAVAEPLDGPSFQTFSALAKVHQCHVVYGMPRCSANGFHIAQVVINADGILIGHYDKLHIAQFGASMEKDYFTRGDHLLSFTVNTIRLAPIICYDIRIPELARTLTLDHDVQLILHCGAYARDESFATWHDFAIARALENQIFLLSLNRAGKEYGNSLFIPPWVDDETRLVTFPAHETCLKTILVDTDTLHQARTTYPFLADRRSDYRQLAHATEALSQS